MKNESKKVRANQIESIREIVDAGGVIKSSDWVRGTGNFIKKRPLPPFCEEFEVGDIYKLKGHSKKAAEKLLKTNPRVKRFIAVTNVRSVNKLLKTV